MTWLRFSDDWENKPEIRTLDDTAYRAYRCLIQAAERFDRFGLVTDDYAMGTYPHSDRRKLRNQVRNLADVGLVHLLDSPGDTLPGCSSCEARATATRQLDPSATRVPVSLGRTATMLICIPGFYDIAMTPEQKEKRKEDSGPARAERRRRQQAAVSGPDNQEVSESPVPVPDPVLSKESKNGAHAPHPRQPAGKIDGVWKHYLDSPLVAEPEATKLTKDRHSKIQARLNEGYTVADLKAAIDGIQRSDWHMKEGQTRLTTILRDGTQVEKFRDLRVAPRAQIGADAEAIRRHSAEMAASRREFAKAEYNERNKGAVPVMAELEVYIQTAQNKAGEA